MFLCSSDYQFGFKSNHLCIYTLKEVTYFYKSQSTSIYVCFMDASKAFDRVNHWKLVKKLIDRGMPLIFVIVPHKKRVLDGSLLYLIIFWSQMVLGKEASCHLCFLICILYTDGLIDALCNTLTGCTIGGITINHLAVCMSHT